MKLSLTSVAAAMLGLVTPLASAANSTYFNPILPGWHSDPSCTRVQDTFFCVTSTFIAFPGLPIYASKDLVNWKLISHAWNRDAQLPGISNTTVGQQEGMFAATIRVHDGVFHVICEYLGQPDGIIGVVFKSKNPFDESAWSDPVIFHPTKIDPDLFWDDDGKVYSATQGIILQELDLTTGELSQPPISLWNGTGGVWPEGPHIYKKDGWYWLMIAEGGTEMDHAITIARSRNITGPYEAYAHNPILTNRGTQSYFQTVGHGDLFTDKDGNWWGVALATRSGPAYQTYPMGRETVLYPVTWNQGEWPILQNVTGKMSAWPLPPTNRNLPGDGPFNSDPDVYDFSAGSAIPRNLIHWRVPRAGAFTTTMRGLQIVPSRNNVTGTPLSTATPELTGQLGMAFIGRRQTDTLFTYSVDLTFNPRVVEQEAGVTVFLTQVNHIDLGVVLMPANCSATAKPKQQCSASQLSFRFRATADLVPVPVPATNIVPVPEGWAHGPIRLQIQMVNQTHYSLAAMPASNPKKKMVLGVASAQLVSGGNGTFVGSLVGAYATCNGAGSDLDCPAGGNAYFQRWRYTGVAQYISATESVPAAPNLAASEI